VIGFIPARTAGSLEAARFSLAATTGSFTSAATLPFDREDRGQSWASLSSGEVTLSVGEYLVLADVTTDEASGNNRTEFESVLEANDGGKGWAAVAGTTRRHYSRLGAQGAQSASISAIIVAEWSLPIRVQSSRASGTSVGQWIADGSSITILRMA